MHTRLCGLLCLLFSTIFGRFSWILSFTQHTRLFVRALSACPFVFGLLWQVLAFSSNGLIALVVIFPSILGKVFWLEPFSIFDPHWSSLFRHWENWLIVIETPIINLTYIAGWLCQCIDCLKWLLPSDHLSFYNIPQLVSKSFCLPACKTSLQPQTNLCKSCQ